MAIFFWVQLRPARSIFLLTILIFFQTSECFMDMEELKSVYYGLHILKEPVPLNQDTPQGAVHVTSKYGQQYQCTFPDHSSEEKRKEEEEKLAMETGIVEILKPMGNSACLFKAKDWWSYEFCFGKYIRQFHVEDGEVKGNIIYLGYYQDDFDWDNETSREARLKGSKSGQGRYHSQNYTLGTKCDLTGQLRRAEVRFVCEENSEDYLSRVDESETCVYTVTVATSRICRHPYLKAPARRKPVPITCNPLLSEDQFESYMQELQEAKVLEQQRLFEADNAKRSKKIQESAELRSLERLFSEVDGEHMEKEEFDKMFGHDEALWKSYMKFLERRKIKKHFDSQQMQEKSKDEDEGEEISTGEEADTSPAEKPEKDEDDEIISEFNDEIQQIKSKFDSSQKSISKIKRKLGWEKKWETEIEDAIQEAERELGVKVDRSLISGLSETLDKLVGKLAETETELASAGEELNKLKPGQTVLTNKDADSSKDDGEEDEEKDASDSQHTEASNPPTEQQQASAETPDISIQAPPKMGPKPHNPLSPASEADISGTDGDAGSDTIQQQQQRPLAQGDPQTPADVTVQAPPKTGSEPVQQESSHRPDRPLTMEEEQGQTTAGDSSTNERKDSAPNTGNVPRTTKDGDDDGGEDDAPELTITLRAIDEDEEGNSKNQLPDKVQKLLEESLKREYKKNKQDSDPQPLTFAADHSFQRDKTVHVIQSEDDDGKTSRYIFVFGFNSQTDEMAEHERQSALEESYGFVYKGNKNKKTSSGA